MICSKNKLDPELGKIRSILFENGYLEHAINSVFKGVGRMMKGDKIKGVGRCLKGIHSRSDTNRNGAEGLSFYYPRLLHCLNQMLEVVLLSQHRVNVLADAVCPFRSADAKSGKLVQKIPRSWHKRVSGS